MAIGEEEDIAEAARRFAPNGVEPVPGERKGIAMLAYDAVAGIEEFKKLNRVIIEANPEIDVPIAGTYRLASAAKAHERIEEGHVLCKIVVRISETELGSIS